MSVLTDVSAPAALPGGLTLPDRLVMAPMAVRGSDPETGHVTGSDLEYMGRRAGVAGLLITGAASVCARGRILRRQLAISDDSDVPGLALLAQAMKSAGGRAIVQLHHGGREAAEGVRLTGAAEAPSSMGHLRRSGATQEMDPERIEEVAAAFGTATRRALAAGFDGVEIHGAWHSLPQQFFSRRSNHRADRWGGSEEGRLAFPLAVLDEALNAAAAADSPFAVGYRLSMDEVRSDSIGYTIADASALIHRLIGRGVDWIDVASCSRFDARPPSGPDAPFAPTGGRCASCGQIARRIAAGRCPVIVSSGVRTQADAERVLEEGHGDLVALGRAALVDPDFATKIAAGRGDSIATSVEGRLHDLALPTGLIDWYLGGDGAVLPALPGLRSYLVPSA